MPPNDLVLYLVLAPEFGGTRFGPFESIEVRLGSNKERSHICIPEALGALPDHARLLRQADRSFVLSPAERSAAVFLYKQDGRRPEQVLTATAVQPGDAFALVTPDGPRFRVELGPLPAAVLEQRQRGRRTHRGLTAGRFFGEVRRMFLATLYTLSPVALATRAWYYVTSGAIWNPRILITTLLFIAGWAGLGVASCSALRYKRQLGIQETVLAETQRDLDTCRRTETDPSRADFGELAGAVVGDALFGKTLAEDEELYTRVVKKVRQFLRARDDEYAWLLGAPEGARTFREFRDLVAANDKFDEVTRRVLPYVYAWPDTGNASWAGIIDSQGQLVCGRGPARLTWRQARSLGMANVRLDALEQVDIGLVRNDPAERFTRLSATWKAGRARDEPPPTPDVPTAIAQVTQGEAVCIHEEGVDDRDETPRVVRALAAELGKSDEHTAPPSDALGAISRIAKLYAADLPNNWYAGRNHPPPTVDFSSGTVSAAVGDQPGGDWVLDRTAEVIARAIVLPCRAHLDGGDREQRAVTLGPLPNPYTCYALYFEAMQKG